MKPNWKSNEAVINELAWVYSFQPEWAVWTESFDDNLNSIQSQFNQINALLTSPLTCLKEK